MQPALYSGARRKLRSQGLSLLEVMMEAGRLHKNDYHRIVFIKRPCEEDTVLGALWCQPRQGVGLGIYFLIKIICKFIQPVRVGLRLQQRRHAGLSGAEPERPR